MVVRDTVETLKQKYPNIYQLQPSIFDHSMECGFLLSEREELLYDLQVVKPLRTLCGLFVSNYLGVEIEDFNQNVGFLLQVLGPYPIHQVQQSLDRIASSYPRIYNLQKEFFDNMIQTPNQTATMTEEESDIAFQLIVALLIIFVLIVTFSAIFN